MDHLAAMGQDDDLYDFWLTTYEEWQVEDMSAWTARTVSGPVLGWDVIRLAGRAQ